MKALTRAPLPLVHVGRRRYVEGGRERRTGELHGDHEGREHYFAARRHRADDGGIPWQPDAVVRAMMDGVIVNLVVEAVLVRNEHYREVLNLISDGSERGAVVPRQSVADLRSKFIISGLVASVSEVEEGRLGVTPGEPAARDAKLDEEPIRAIGSGWAYAAVDHVVVVVVIGNADTVSASPDVALMRQGRPPEGVAPVRSLTHQRLPARAYRPHPTAEALLAKR